MNFRKTDIVLIFTIIVIFVVVACQNLATAPSQQNVPIQSTSSQQVSNEPQQPIPQSPQVQEQPKVPESPKGSVQEILVENVQTQGQSGQQNQAPRILITEPDGGDVVTVSPYTVWWKAEDPNGDKLLIRIEYKSADDTAWTLLSNNEPDDRSFEWDLGNLKNGNYQIKLTVTDGILSNSDTKSFELKR